MKTEEIPEGMYCYDVSTGASCLYWNYVGRYNGYCAFLNRDDNHPEGLGLLWDQVKECGINDPGD